MSSRFFPLVLIPGFALCALLVQFSNSHLEQARVQYSTQEIEAAKESIALSLMGQIQLTAHSLIWMKTLEYLHNGVALRMPTESEERQGYRAHEATDVATGLAHKCGIPVALDKGRDWRGPVGALHRTIVPHMQIHQHSDPVELIPWYQLTLKLNPNLERLYTLSAFFLADFAQEPREALELLEKGVEANPWTFEIRAALGRMLFDYHQQLGIEPEVAYERAAAILADAVEEGKQERSRLRAGKDDFDAYQSQLFHESYLFLARSLTELGQYDEALALCREGYKATMNNLLKVQERITEKRRNGGEAPPMIHQVGAPDAE